MRSLVQPMSVAALERFVFSKPTFDRYGLIVAVEDGQVQGFAHAGFGPSKDQNTLSTENGVTSLVMLRPEVDPSVARELLARCEAYLAGRGAKVLYGGGNFPLAPFYTGLYGGSEYSGVLDSDPRLQSIFREHGYAEAKRSLVLRRELAGFRPQVDRQQMQIRRQTTFETIIDPRTTTWWEAVLFEPFDRTQCYLQPRDRGGPTASVNFWAMETYLGAWGVHAVGIVGLEVTSQKLRQGLATFLLGEAFRQLNAQGVALAEVQVAQDNEPALRLFRNLGFEQIDQSMLYRKV